MISSLIGFEFAKESNELQASQLPQSDTPFIDSLEVTSGQVALRRRADEFFARGRDILTKNQLALKDLQEKKRLSAQDTAFDQTVPLIDQQVELLTQQMNQVQIESKLLLEYMEDVTTSFQQSI